MLQHQQQKFFSVGGGKGCVGCRLSNSKFSDKNVRRKKSLLYLQCLPHPLLPLVNLASSLPPFVIPRPHLLAIAIIVYFLTLLSKWSDPSSTPLSTPSPLPPAFFYWDNGVLLLVRLAQYLQHVLPVLRSTSVQQRFQFININIHRLRISPFSARRSSHPDKSFTSTLPFSQSVAHSKLSIHPSARYIFIFMALSRAQPPHTLLEVGRCLLILSKFNNNSHFIHIFYHNNNNSNNLL